MINFETTYFFLIIQRLKYALLIIPYFPQKYKSIVFFSKSVLVKNRVKAMDQPNHVIKFL